MAVSKVAWNRLLEEADGDARALIAVARAMMGQWPARAAAVARDVLLMTPPASTVNAAETLLRGMAPEWHFEIVKDAARNTAYQEALTRAVTARSRVLDIGSGTGLLAMMAARAGARDIMSCEMNAAVAGAAKEVLAANGFADRVTLIERHSSELDLDRDLGGPLDVIVSEIISNNLVGQGCLPVMEQAACWLKPGGRMIPQAGAVRVALGWSEPAERLKMADVQGLDLSAFNRLRPATQHHGIGHPGLSLRSSAADLMRFDFRSGGPFPAEEVRVRVTAEGGMVNGVIQWVHLQLDDVISYENRPEPGARSCWAAVFYALPKVLEFAPGESVIVAGAHDRASLRIWVED